MSRRGSRGPRLVGLAAALSTLLLGLPLLGLIRELDIAALPASLLSDRARQALLLSLLTSLTATALAVLLGVPFAWWLVHGPARWVRLVRPLVLLPLVLPPVVGGVALLSAFGRRGLIGGPLYDALGIQLPFTTAGVVLAELFVAMPFLVVSVEGALRGLDPRIEEAARTLGASPWRVLLSVTLPLIAPSLLAGSALCWARALGEFGATITFAGSFPGSTQTIPLAVYAALEVDRSEAVALSALLIGVCLAVLVALRGRMTAGRGIADAVR